MRTKLVPLEELVLDDRNARQGDVDAQMESLREFGQHRPVVAQQGSHKVIAGNHLCLAAKALGWERVNVLYVEDDDPKALRRALADNLVADKAKWQQDQLASLLREVEARESLPGIDDKMLEKLLAETEVDEAPAALLPISPRPGEGYSYVVIIATTDMDGAWLQETLGLRKQRSYKSEQQIGISRVITVDDLKAVLNAAAKRGEEFV